MKHVVLLSRYLENARLGINFARFGLKLVVSQSQKGISSIENFL